MNRLWILENTDRLDSAILWLSDSENIEAITTSKNLYCLELKEYSKIRSLAQNSIYWKWLGAISKHTGHTDDELHDIYKEKFLVKIYERDDTKYAEMIRTLRNLYKDHPKESMELFRAVIRLTSTTKAKVKQFTEYLEKIERDCFDNKIPLPMKDDEYSIAMGDK
jgi:hypothetical protein